MRKVSKWVGLFLSALLLSGCGSATTPEIIMPKEPLQPSVTSQKTDNSDISQENSTAQGSGTSSPSGESSQPAPPQTSSGNSYTVYLITMDLADSYWQSIDQGCQSADHRHRLLHGQEDRFPLRL